MFSLIFKKSFTGNFNRKINRVITVLVGYPDTRHSLSGLNVQLEFLKVVYRYM